MFGMEINFSNVFILIPSLQNQYIVTLKIKTYNLRSVKIFYKNIANFENKI